MKKQTVDSINRRIHKNDNILKSRMANAKTRAKKVNMDFNLDIEFLEDLLKEQDYSCAYTRLRFDNEDSKYSVSIDRIDSKKGYLKDNVQLVLTAINYMKQEYTEGEFIEFCKKVYLNSIL